MDQRIAWPQPEQLGPSCEQWSHIWDAFHINENTNTSSNGNHTSVKLVSINTQSQTCNNSNPNNDEAQQEKQVLANNQSNLLNASKQNPNSTTPATSSNRESTSLPISSTNHNTVSANDQETMKRTMMQARAERSSASTTGLGSTENLSVLSNNDFLPWAREEGYNAKVPVLGLHKEIVDFYQYVSPTEEERLMRQQVATRIAHLITTVWPNARVEIFGSFKTGLYLPTSDIDMVVIGISRCDSKSPLRELERIILERRVAEPQNVKVLDNATVPIVRVTDRETDVRVDISFSSTESPSCVRSAELIRGYMQRYEPLRYLVLVLKQFLLERGLNETWTGGVGSYSLILMVVHFLQNHERGQATKNYGALLVEFFETFGERFNYQQLVLRVMNETEMSASAGSAKAYLKKEEFTRAVQREEPSYCPAMLTIEDPLEPLRDIARGSYGALYARKAFQHALHALREPMLGLAHSLLVRNHLGNVPTYLGRIIRIKRAVSDYRDQVRRKYQPLLQFARQESLGASGTIVHVAGLQVALNGASTTTQRTGTASEAYRSTATNGSQLVTTINGAKLKCAYDQPPATVPVPVGVPAAWQQPLTISAVSQQILGCHPQTHQLKFSSASGLSLTQTQMPIASNGLLKTDQTPAARGSHNELSDSAAHVDIGTHVPQYANSINGVGQCNNVVGEASLQQSQSSSRQSLAASNVQDSDGLHEPSVASDSFNRHCAAAATGANSDSDRIFNQSHANSAAPHSTAFDRRVRSHYVVNGEHRHRDAAVRSDKRGMRHSLPNRKARSSPSSSPSTDLDGAVNGDSNQAGHVNEVYRSRDSADDDDDDEDEEYSAPPSASSSDEPRVRPLHDYRLSFAAAAYQSAANFARMQRSHRGRATANGYSQMNGRAPPFSDATVAPRHRYMHRNVHAYNSQANALASNQQQASSASAPTAHGNAHVASQQYYRNGDEMRSNINSLVRKVHRSATLDSRPNANASGTHSQHTAPAHVQGASSFPSSRTSTVPNGSAYSHKRKRSGEQLNTHGVS